MKISKDLLIKAGKIALAVAALGYLLYVVDPDRIWQTAANANGWYVLAAFALLPLNLFFEALIWQRMARNIIPDLSFPDALASLFSGHAAGIVTPARIGDLAGRAWYLPRASNWELGSAALVHRLYDMAAVTAVGLVSLQLFLQWETLPFSNFLNILWWILLGAGILLALGLLMPPRMYSVLRRLLPERAARHLTFLQRMTTANGFFYLLLALCRFAVYITQFVFLIFAFAAVGALGPTIVGVTLVFLFKSVVPPVTYLDIGIREGLSVIIFGALGYAEAVAFNAAFILFCMNLLLPSAIGVYFLLRVRRRSDGPAPATDDTETASKLQSESAR